MFDKLRKIVLSAIAVVSVGVLGYLGATDHAPFSSKSEAPTQVNKGYFDEALAVVLKHEGYLSNDPVDKGGLTKWGVSLRFLQIEKIDVDGDGDVDIDDIKKLTKTDADKIYLNKFWNRNGYGRILDKKIAIKMMDISVNTGANRAHKILKKAINDVIYSPIEVNGILDNDTIELVNFIDSKLLLDALRNQQKQFYLDIIKITPSYIKFKNGWLNRAKW